MSTAPPSIAITGQPLAPTSAFIPGPGTYASHDQIHASLSGYTTTIPSSSDSNSLPILSVVTGEEESGEGNVVPGEGNIVLGRVVRISPKQAVVNILVVGDVACREEFQGIIRQQDIRLTQTSHTKIYSSFRPNDIIRAQIISLGDQYSYFLSTARNDLGVVFAMCEESGEMMYPVSYGEMRCPKTGVVEERKCAKPV
ncbi:hypothetical protein SAICODRAFT_29233 [Saitoella complicata NRRL Y-17804]|uniref:S1 motif domain-containing protein n=1 Tax=Saitoella complicata (strain BCRC 22490 / CBS 7301 / JCM 7358 / NBRC 10748 / NRRL Y-17804) TaxID=698492 RepID=A0A0E9NQA1_SAICN|nr:uncharacterized protein SAICODRAFT_29233 [Saitoella complicata NRRL Y-17804]ODQ55047.1 hypothetical protein SAICODRAFT_29233 [Saitoella complicata NRRL Y-17804]GAO52052.1 hypothetical protein G7K_6139-t1 [Saitoella complicata NRRL Y-17804]